MNWDENLDFARGEHLRLNIVVTNLIRRLYAAKLAILPGPKRLFLKDRLRPREW
jgi:hypothetical protein